MKRTNAWRYILVMLLSLVGGVLTIPSGDRPKRAETTERNRNNGKADAVLCTIHVLFTHGYADELVWAWTPELNFRTSGKNRAEALAHLFFEMHEFFKINREEVEPSWEQALGKDVAFLHQPSNELHMHAFDIPLPPTKVRH
jgi:hypothetical protein